MTTQLCPICFNATEHCPICNDPNRNKSTILVVERPSDIAAFEQTGRYKGVYHVLHGLLPTGTGMSVVTQPKIPELIKRLQGSTVKKLILGLMPTQPGEATMKAIREELQRTNLTDLKVESLHSGKANN
jgi:recombination protein RecR